MKKNIAFITTGGTIASIKSDKGLIPGSNVSLLNEHISKKIESLINIDIFDLYNIDSSDVKINNFELLSSKIKEINHKYDGFVVTHGTDTMSYSASVLSYMLKGLNKPVILTGSMIPIEQEGTDAIDNLINSLNASINSLLNGVYICFGDKLIYGNKSVKLDTSSFTTFASPNFGEVGIFNNNILILNKEILEKINHKINQTSSDFDIDEKLENKVFLLKLHPGIDYNIFNFLVLNGYKGIVIEGYGDGNVPSDKDFLEKVKMCLDSGIKIILKSQCISGVSNPKYAGGKALIDLGCYSSDNLTTESSISKLMWALKKSGGIDEIFHQLISKDINGDLLV